MGKLSETGAWGGPPAAESTSVLEGQGDKGKSGLEHSVGMA